ncbi:MAG: ribosome biogenesis GTP-binding protein YihA/YsxC [Clostridia bacterium]|nr:ribosome biogenesis GTP-binding protein YihA/YsxC [Clostridia bacterium]
MKIKYESAAFETSAGVESQLFSSDMPEIAFSGRSNVGKSSLLNKLLNRKQLARVSSVPGKTVTVNFFKLNCCRFVDLPGYGYAKVSHAEKLRWASLMESYFSQGRNIKLVVQLFDMRHEPSQDDMDMLSFLSETGIPFAVALTKCDKLNKTERSKMILKHCEIITKYGAVPVVPFSAINGEGVNDLRAIIENSLEK